MREFWEVAAAGFAYFGSIPVAAAALVWAQKQGMNPSITGLIGGLLGFLAFFIPRLWMVFAFLRGDEMDETLGEFWEFATVSFVYIPAVAAALLWPQHSRWLVFLLVAAAGQALALRLAGEPNLGGLEVQANAPWLAVPATLLLLLAAAINFMHWCQSPHKQRSTEH